MSLRSFGFAGALVAGLLAGSTPAQSISAVASSDDATPGVAPVSAAVGSVLTIDGSGFGDKKPKAWLENAETSKKYPLKVTAYSDSQLTAEVKKGLVGPLSLKVQPKGGDAIDGGSVTIEAPVISEIQAGVLDGEGVEAGPEDEVTILGDYFGIKKGKIKVGGKAAKVLSWIGNEIHILMPKKLPNGVWEILLDNKLATNGDYDIEMIGSLLGLGKSNLTLLINGVPKKIKYGANSGNPLVPDLSAYDGVVFGLTGSAAKPFIFVLAMPFLDGSDLPAELVYPGSVFYCAIFDVNGANSQYYVCANGFEATINAASGGQIAGTFGGTMDNLMAGDDIEIEGTFTIDLEDS